ncbi:15691_t:CDS:2, partial [Dentiscutata heterogama]
KKNPERELIEGEIKAIEESKILSNLTFKVDLVITLIDAWFEFFEWVIPLLDLKKISNGLKIHWKIPTKAIDNKFTTKSGLIYKLLDQQKKLKIKEIKMENNKNLETNISSFDPDIETYFYSTLWIINTEEKSNRMPDGKYIVGVKSMAKNWHDSKFKLVNETVSQISPLKLI